jgi:hypothetical protein
MTQTHTLDSNSVYLQQAIQTLMEGMGTADNFLEFLTDSLSAVHALELAYGQPKPTVEAHYAVVLLTKEVAVPWLLGGPQMLSKMIFGLANVFSFFGPEPLFHAVSRIAEARHREHVNFGVLGLPGVNALFEELRSLYLVASILRQFDLSSMPGDPTAETLTEI